MKQLLLVLAGLCILMSSGVMADQVSIVRESSNTTPVVSDSPGSSADKAAFAGSIKVYIAEPVARWKDYSNLSYHNGFLDFAFELPLNIADLSTWEYSADYDASQTQWTAISETNIMAIAAVFSSTSQQEDAYPPNGYYFQAYYTQASAEARAGEVGSSTPFGGFSHSVFAEEGTATWCQYCPPASAALYNIEQSEDYPFHFVTLVGDKSTVAYNRLDVDFNFAGYPSTFFDGGDQLYVGSGSAESQFRNRIVACAGTAVADLNMLIATDWIGPNQIRVRVKIGNGVAPNAMPADPSVPTGVDIAMLDTEYDFEASATDPDGDDLYYQFDWGNGDLSDWMGPIPSGQSVVAPHTFGQLGSYEIKVCTRDVWQETTEWSDTKNVLVPCCLGSAGNVNADPADNVDISDLTGLVNHLFVTFEQLSCRTEANTNGDAGCNVDISDLTKLVNHLFVTFEPLANCQMSCE